MRRERIGELGGCASDDGASSNAYAYRVATHILAYDEEGGARFWEGNYGTYHERLLKERAEAGLGKETRGTHRRFRG